MSHLKVRSEKICLNCNAQLAGPYCHICGQENIEPKETVWHLITHFFNDITHFDGKFFNTVGLLVSRPGFLPGEYMSGRRASYLNPVRMYIFTSAVFFLVFFSVFHVPEKVIENSIIIDGKTVNEILTLSPDSLREFTAKINQGKPIASNQLEKYIDSVKNTGGFHLTGTRYKSKQEYDSMVRLGIKKHNWLQRKLIYKEIEANEKYHNSFVGTFTSFAAAFMHSFPQILFFSLPIFALFLKLLYWRQKKYYYVSHGIFSIHFYIFVIISLFLLLSLGELKNALHWEWLRYLRMIFGVGIFFYLYMAIRNFYQQSSPKSFLKFLLLVILSALMMGCLFIVFSLFSFMKI